MRRLSPEARELISQLDRPASASWLARLLRSGDSRRPSAVRRIAATGEIAALPYLRNYLLSKDRRIREAAEAAVLALIARLRPRDVVWCDQHLRESWLMSIDWNCHLTPDRLNDIASSTGFKSAWLALASCHGSGYVRERAVELLRKLVADGTELPFLLVRCNDWVEQVRTPAVEAVRERLTPAYAVHFVRNLWLARRLRECGRTAQAAIPAQVDGFLAQPSCREALLAGLHAPDRDVCRASFELLVAARHEPLSHLLERVAQSPDATVRFRAASVAVNALVGEELKTALRVFVKDSAMPVRRTALTCLVERFPDWAGPGIEEALFDRHSSMRETARFLIGRQQPGRKFRDDYANRLGSASGWVLTAAIAGIGECGEAADAELVVPYLSDALPRNRRAALRAADRLNRSAAMPELLRAILDESPGVSRTAAVLLRQRPFGPHSEPLLELAETAQRTHVACNLLSLIAQLSSWRAVCAMLAACSREDIEVVEHAKLCLRVLVSRSFTPTGCKDDMVRASMLLAQVRHMLPQAVLDPLDFMLRRS